MRLPHVFLFATALGTCGSLLLAVDVHYRMQDASRADLISKVGPAADSFPGFGIVYFLGFVALAFLFMALFLMLLAAFRDRKFVAQLEGSPESDSQSTVVDSPVVAVSDSTPVVLTTTDELPADVSPSFENKTKNEDPN